MEEDNEFFQAAEERWVRYAARHPDDYQDEQGRIERKAWAFLAA